jgi:hypothetical protein
MQGVGGMGEPIRFYIDSGDVYHLVYCDESSKIDVDSTYAYTEYHHSYSRDGGKTWEGPFFLFDIKNENEAEWTPSIEDVAIFEDSNGRLQIAVVYEKFSCPNVEVTTLNADSFEVEKAEGYFGDEKTSEVLSQLPIDEMSIYHGMVFQTVVADNKDKLHFVTNGVDAQFWDVSQLDGGVWSLRDIQKPSEEAYLTAVFLRSNGNLAILSKEYCEPLYYAEITPVQ